MKLVRLNSTHRIPDSSPIFIGEVSRQPVVDDDEATHLRVSSVTFHDGARNRLHHHDADQVLVVTEGSGRVASESQVLDVTVGDVVLIPAGERHWHGANPGETFSHLSILTPGPITIDEPEGATPPPGVMS